MPTVLTQIPDVLFSISFQGSGYVKLTVNGGFALQFVEIGDNIFVEDIKVY